MRVYTDKRGWEYCVRSNGLTGKARKWHVYYRRQHRPDPDQAWRSLRYHGGKWHATEEAAAEDLDKIMSGRVVRGVTDE